MITGLVTVLAMGCAFLAGIAGLFDIATSGGRRTGYGFAVIGAAAPFFLVLGLFYVPTLGGVQHTAYRMTCGTNLSRIGKAMLIYANDYGDELPLAGERGTAWGSGLNDWTAANRSEAFGLDPKNAGGQATIGSSLYLLVRYRGLAPKTFVCDGDRGTRPFDPNEHHTTDDKGLATHWDFGRDPAEHCSYSYHMPYGPHRLTTASEPGMAIAADRNPWFDGPRWKASDFSKFQWNGTTRQQRAGNAVAHWLDGQNVLFLDSHTGFVKRSLCGIGDDNIYTLWDGADKVQGIPAQFGSTPANVFDSLLVNDPVAP